MPVKSQIRRPIQAPSVPSRLQLGKPSQGPPPHRTGDGDGLDAVERARRFGHSLADVRLSGRPATETQPIQLNGSDSEEEEEDRGTTSEILTRAYKRAEKRSQRGSTRSRYPAVEKLREASVEYQDSGGSVSTETPFGPITLSPFGTNDPSPKITTKQTDYGKKSSVGHKYSDLASGLTSGGQDEDEVAAEILASLKSSNKRKLDVLKSGKERNSASKAIGISHISEPGRVHGSDKAFRGGLRMVEAEEVSFDDLFTGSTPLFPLAKNPDYYRRLVNPLGKKYRKEIDEPPKWDELAEYISESSSESESSSSESESDSSDDEPAVKKKFKKGS